MLDEPVELTDEPVDDEDVDVVDDVDLVKF
jgi:hypothetical protein